MQKSVMTVSLIAVGVIAATALTTARSRSSLRADRIASTEQSLVREAAPFNRLVRNRADELRLELSRLASTHAPKESAPSAFDSGRFDGMAWIEPAGGAEKSDEWVTKWVSGGTPIDAAWLQSLPLKNLHDGDAVFVRFGTGESALEGLLITAESFAPGATVVEGQGHRVVLFGILNQNAFAGLVDDWVGSSRVAQIFDEKGVVLAHTNRRSVGAQLKEDGIVRALASGQRTSASGVFDDSEGRPLVAQAQRIPQTNLRLSLSVPQRLLDQTIAGTLQAVFWLSLIGFSLLAALAYWVYRRLLQAAPRAPMAGPGLTARIAEVSVQTQVEPPQTVAPVLTFEDIEIKAKANVKEILDRSAAIRARLNLDFVEDFTDLPPAIEPNEKTKRDLFDSAPLEHTSEAPRPRESSGFMRKPRIKDKIQSESEDQTERNL